MMAFDRRRLLKAGGLGLAGLGARMARAAESAPPTRIVFFIQPHGHVPDSWHMPIPGGRTDAVAQRDLTALPESDFSPVLRPLHTFAPRLLAIEGLSHTSALHDIAAVKREGKAGDFNNHQIAVAGLLTGARAAQDPGFGAYGGARSIDQELGLRTTAPGRFGSRVYGSDYTPNLAPSPFSFVGPSQAAPMVTDPAQAFMDLVGSSASPDASTRGERLRALRGSVLDTVAREFTALASRLPSDDRRKLDEHATLVRDLETNLSADVSQTCDRTQSTSGGDVSRFMQVIRIALSCDLTRVITYQAPVPQAPEFGYPASAIVHATYAHASVKGSTSCGLAYDPVAHQAMTDLSVWYANHFLFLLRQLDAVREEERTLLDHTVVVWITELGTPTHEHHDAPVLIAGGSSFFKTGRYVRYPRTFANPVATGPVTGPGHNRLYVSLMRAMGQSDDRFGLAEALGADGSKVPLTGPLLDLHRA